MKLAVIIPTFGRRELVEKAVQALAAQTRRPDEIVVSAPDRTHVEQRDYPSLRVSYVFGPAGTTKQRNRALSTVLASADIVTFFDDDFLPAADYLEAVERLFREHPDWKVLTGHVVLDGAGNAGYSIQEGQRALAQAEAGKGAARVSAAEATGGYGCNMSMRAADIGEQRFDERLPLYGWQEDIDFSRRISTGGRIIICSELLGVHLGHKRGRVSGVRFGYSQIVNPIYLMRKGSMPLRFAVTLMARNVAANLARSLWPEPYVDRRGRLKGNLRAAGHVVRGRIEPEFILKL